MSPHELLAQKYLITALTKFQLLLPRTLTCDDFLSYQGQSLICFRKFPINKQNEANDLPVVFIESCYFVFFNGSFSPTSKVENKSGQILSKIGLEDQAYFKHEDIWENKKKGKVNKR